VNYCATLLAVRPFSDLFYSLLKRYLAVITIAAGWLPGNSTLHAADRHFPSIIVRFEPVMVNGRNAFHVIESFRVHQPETEFVIPTHWGGADHLEQQTQNLKIDSPGDTLTDQSANAGHKILHARPGTRVQLSYNIVPQQTEWFRHPQEHMAIINNDYFLFNPQNALVYPKLPLAGEVNVTFDWRALPGDIPIITSFGIIRGGDRHRLTRVRAPWIQILDGLLAGGNFRLSESKANGTRVVLAARGIWRFSDTEVLKDVQRIVDEANQFWRDKPMPYFLVTLAPFDRRTGDNDGSGFTTAYMLFLSHEDIMDAERLQLMAHEMFHHWNPMSMGTLGTDDVAKWFSEGFTVYYSGVIPLRSGITSYPDYVKYLNLWLRRYQLSPFRQMSEAAWKSSSHSSGEGYSLPYERGAAIALWADAAIRARSNGKRSLDNVMFDLVRESKTGNPAPDFTEQRVLTAFSPYLSKDKMDQLRRMAIAGADVPLPDKLGGCAVKEKEIQSIVDPGFDQSASFAAKRLAGVVQNGPAYRAGMRDGQELFTWSIYNDDPSKDALLGVVIDGKKRTVTFSPVKQSPIEQYRASVTTEAAKGCTPF
jgi:predicted metalloprotease with PDZ domain